MDVLLVLGPGLNADRDLLTSLATTTAGELGAGLRVVVSACTSETAAALAAHDGPAVVVPADRALMGGREPDAGVEPIAGTAGDAGVTAVAGLTLGTGVTGSVVWYDLTVAAEPAASTHLHGRGVWGLAWAVRHAVHRLRRPATRIAYGEHPEQWADERHPEPPAGAAAAPAPAPVGVLIHGGFWRSIWAADLMDALAIDLAERGWRSWNLEYRRPDRHGWAATTADVAAGVAAARDRHPGAPVVLFGHSAGGQLALRLAADDPDLTLAVSLAGVLDLTEGQRRFLGEGAITTALGGTPEEQPGAYAAGDPFARLPLASPALLVQGAGDGLDLVDINRRFAAASGIPLLERPGDHFDVIAPASAIWAETMAEVTRLISHS